MLPHPFHIPLTPLSVLHKSSLMASSKPSDPTKPVTGHPSDDPQAAASHPYFQIPPPSSPHCGLLLHLDHNNSSVSASILYLLLTFLGSLITFSLFLRLLSPIPPIPFLPPSFLLSSPASLSFQLTNLDVLYDRLETSVLTKPDVIWNLSFQVTNPNENLDVLYDRLETSVLYNDEVLTARTELPPVDQGMGNRTVMLNARLLRKVDVSKAIGEEEEEEGGDGGVVRYAVRVSGMVRFRRGCEGWTTRKRLMRVFCGGVEVGFDSAGEGRLLNPGKECEVEM